MLFSSNTFLFLFLPLTLALYYIVPGRRIKNRLLLLASLFFYAWGEPYYVLLLLANFAANYTFALYAEKYRQTDPFKAGAAMALMAVFNIALLILFKYTGFLVRNINLVLKLTLHVPDITLPIGISFFTFQAISYVVDVYKGRAKAQRNILNMALYISLFPQLIAGPIVRYETVAQQINGRKESWESFSQGVSRFIIGLSKKVLLSNALAVIADKAFDASPYPELTVVGAWLGAVAYTLQIYFDFSGYSDMAIGLGKMFGFAFEENFRYPYVARNITDFWRRWHISLSTWFRDYVYTPLGGSRMDSRFRNIRNLFVVWLLTGLWHGTSWNFVAWGIFYFCLLVIERYLIPMDAVNKYPVLRGGYQLFTIVCVIGGWVLFRAPGLKNAIRYGLCMFGLRNNAVAVSRDVFDITENLVILIVSALCCLPWSELLLRRANGGVKRLYRIVYPVIIMAMFIASVSSLVKGAYNPFIYFNF